MSTHTSSKCDGISKGGWNQYLIALWCLHRRNKPTAARVTKGNTKANISIRYPVLVASEKEKKRKNINKKNFKKPTHHIHPGGSYLYIKCKTIYSKLKFTTLGNQSIISKATITTRLWRNPKHLRSEQRLCFAVPRESHELPGALSPPRAA